MISALKMLVDCIEVFLKADSAFFVGFSNYEVFIGFGILYIVFRLFFGVMR